MISHKIFKSKLNTKPFNYIHIEKLIDDKTVAKLIKKFPQDKYFKKKKDITKYETKRKLLGRGRNTSALRDRNRNWKRNKSFKFFNMFIFLLFL